jgi:hypothetical protein
VTVRSSVGRRKALGVTMLLLAAGGTAACSAQAGAAAVVEGEPIAVEDVQRAAEQLAPYLDGATPASVLLVLVAEPTVQRIAAENGVAVSDQEAEQLLTELASDTPGAPEFGPASVAVARFSLLQQGLSQLPDGAAVQEDVLARLQDLDVEVNPRYGDLDFSRGGLAPVEHPWLVPAAS